MVVHMIYRRPQAWLPWAFALGISLWLALATRLPRWDWSLIVVLTGPVFNLVRYIRPPLHVLTADRLVRAAPPGTAEHMPLAGARVERVRRRWLLSWPEAKAAQPQTLRVSVAFGQALQAAVAAKAGKTDPAATVEVARAGQPPWFWALVVIAILGVAAGLWLGHPVYLILYAGLVWPLFFDERFYILTNTHVFVVVRSKIAATFPISDLTLRGRWRLASTDTNYHTLRLEYASADGVRFMAQFERLKAMQPTDQ